MTQSTGVPSVSANPCPAGWTHDAANGECVRSFTTVGSETWTPAAGVTSIKYLVVGGGGGGAQGGASSRGGAGGQVLTSNDTPISGAPITVTVGAGGNATVAGSLSRIAWTGTTITANGGSAGGGNTGVGTSGPSSSLSGTAVVYGSNGGQGGGFEGGPGAGRGAANFGGCGGALSGTANRGGGGGGGGVCDFGFGPTPTVGAAGGSGIVIIRYGAFAVTSFSTAVSATTNAASLAYTLTFTGAVDATSITAADFSNSGTAVGCTYSITPSTGSATTFTITVAGCSDGTVIPTLASGSVIPAAGGTGPGAAAQGGTVTVDTTPPAAPATPDLVSASDTGLSSSDNITSDTTPTMSAGGGVNGDTVTISAVNGGTTRSCSYVVGSATSCDLPSLTEGTWSVSATLTDQANNTSSAGPTLPLVVDTSSPTTSATPDLVTASDTGSSSTDDLTSDTTPALSLAGVPADHRVEFSAVNGGTTRSCSYVVGSATSCDLPSLTDGTWSVTARVTDPAGNQSPPTASLSLSIDASAPVAPSAPDLAASSDTGSSSTDNLTSDTTPDFSVAGGTNGDITTVSATNGTDTVTCSYVVGSATGCTMPAMSAGSWSVSATRTDPAGNVSPTGSALSMTVDTSAPVPSAAPDLSASSDTGSSNTDNITADTTPTMSLAGGANGDTVRISATDGTTTVSCSYVVGAATSCDLPLLSDGSWSITGRITDAAGNESATTVPTPITIDTGAPSGSGVPDLMTSSDTGSSSVDNLTSDTTPSFSMPGTPSGHLVEFTATNGSTTVSCSYVAGNASSCDLPVLSGGNWSVTGRITDPAGNQSPPSSPLSFALDTSAPSAPAAPDLVASSDTGSSNTDNITSDTTPDVSVSGGSTGDTVTVSATNGVTTVSCTYVVGLAASCTLPALADGTWTIFGSARDTAGNTTASSGSLSVTVDTTAPAPAIADLADSSDLGTSSTDNLTADNTPEISVPGAARGDTVTISASNGSQTVTCSYVVGAASSCSLPTLTDGTWEVTAGVVDAVGLSGSTASQLRLSIRVVTVAPVSRPDLADASDNGASRTDNVTSDTTPTMSVVGGSTGDRVTVTATKGTTVRTCTYSVGSAASCDLSGLTTGTWVVTSQLMDAAGNRSQVSAPLSMRIVSSAPVNISGGPTGSDDGDTSSSSDGGSSTGEPEAPSTTLPAGTPGGNGVSGTTMVVPTIDIPKDAAGADGSAAPPVERDIPFPADESTLFLASALTLLAMKRRRDADGPRRMAADEREANNIAEFSAGSGSGGLDVRRDLYVPPRWERFDKWICLRASRWSAFSPALGRIMDDGSYLRALVGVFYLLLPLIGGAFGYLAASDTAFVAALPELTVFLVVVTIGALDATSGLVAATVYAVSLLANGGFESADSVRGVLAITAPMVLVGLVASAMRPYRRETSEDVTWKRICDLTLIPLMGAWAAGTMYTAIPHLSGFAVEWSDRKGAVELATLIVLVLRYGLENLARLAVPARLEHIENESLPDPEEAQKFFSRVIRTALFVFVAVVFIGMNPWLICGAVMFLVPRLAEKFEDRYPDLPVAYRYVPRQITRIVFMMFVSMWWGSTVMGSVESDDIQWAFVLMGIPGLAMGTIDLFVRSGKPWPSTWYSKVLGVVVLAVGVGTVRGWWF